MAPRRSDRQNPKKPISELTRADLFEPQITVGSMLKFWDLERERIKKFLDHGHLEHVYTPPKGGRLLAPFAFFKAVLAHKVCEAGHPPKVGVEVADLILWNFLNRFDDGERDFDGRYGDGQDYRMLVTAYWLNRKREVIAFLLSTKALALELNGGAKIPPMSRNEILQRLTRDAKRQVGVLPASFSVIESDDIIRGCWSFCTEVCDWDNSIEGQLANDVVYRCRHSKDGTKHTSDGFINEGPVNKLEHDITRSPLFTQEDYNTADD